MFKIVCAVVYASTAIFLIAIPVEKNADSIGTALVRYLNTPAMLCQK